MFYEGKTLKEAKKDVDSFWSYLYQKKKDTDWLTFGADKIRVDDSNIDNYIFNASTADPSKLNEYITTLTDVDKKVKAGTYSWTEYSNTLDDNEKWIARWGQETEGQIRTTDDLVQANKNARQAAIAHNAALKQQTLGAKAANLAMKGLALVGNVVGGMLIGLVVSKTIEFFSNLANEVENTRESAEGFSNSISEFNGKLKENKDTLSTLNKRYKELSQGVGQFGQNLRLTNADYEEYKGIISQVSDIMPDLAVRYNEQGEKIGFVKGQLEDLNAEYKIWQQNQARKFIVEGDEEGNTFQDVLDNYKHSTNGVNVFGDEGVTSWSEAWTNAFKEVFSLGFLNTFESTYTADTKKNLFEKLRNSTSKDDVLDLMSDYTWDMDADEERQIFGASKGEIKDMTDEEFEQWRNNLNGYISKYQSEIDSANNKLREGMKMLVMSQDGYWAEGVSDEERGAISNFISSMTEDMLKTFMDEDGNISQAALSNFVSKITNAFATDGELFNAYDSLMAEEFENMPYAESTQAVNGWISKIASSTGFTAEQLKEMFGVNEDVMEPLRKTLTDGGLEKSVAQIEKSFGRLRGSHIEEITSMMTSSGKSTEEQAKALDILGQSMDSFDKATGGELTRILENLDSSDPESVKKYNEEIQNFFDTIKNSDEFGEEFSSVIGVLEDALGDASVAFENFEAKYNNFLALAEKGNTSTGETAISKAIDVLKTGLEEGSVNSNLFNEALNLVFGDKRPTNLADALSEIELLFGTGENSASKLFNELGNFSTDGLIDFKKMREELNLSDAAFAAIKEKLQNMGVLLANTEDMNRIGDGLGLSNDRVLQFESEAQSLVKQYKDGTLSVGEYNSKVKELSTNYGLASDAAIDFERNMNFAASGKYMIADDEFGGNITSFLGIGGDVALEIESFIAETHDKFKNAEITSDSILDTDTIKEDIRQKLRATGEYTETEIETMVSEIEERVRTVRLETAIEAEINKTELTGIDADEQTKEAIKTAIMDSFDSTTGTIDIGKLETKISGLEFVKSGATSKETLMKDLGFTQNNDGTWNLEGSSGIGKLAIGLSTETASKDIQGILAEANNLQDILNNLNKTDFSIDIKHKDLEDAEGQALSTKYTLQEMQRKGYKVPVKFTYTDKPKGFETEDTETGGDSEVNGNAFADGSAFGVGQIGAKRTEDALGGELGQEIVVDRSTGTWRTIGDNGAEFFHINKGDIVFNAEQTRSLLKNGRINSRGKSYANGTAYAGRIPSGGTTTTTTTTTTKNKNTSSSPDYEDPTDVIIDRINLRHRELEQQEEYIENAREIAELENDYKKQISLTNDKLDAQKQRLDALKTANGELHQMAEDLRNSTPQWNEEEWFDSQGNATEAYNTLYNNSSKEEREKLKDQFEKISKIKQAWVENDEERLSLAKEILQTEENIVNLDFEHSQDWIDERNTYNDWALFNDSEIDAWERVIKRLKEDYKDCAGAAEKLKEAEENLYEARKEQFDKATDFHSSILDSRKTVLQSYYDTTNAIAEGLHEINKELETSKTMYEWLDEDTRKLLFNQEDYNVLYKELIDIQSEADRLQKQYEYDLENSTLETVESITSQYEMQYEALMKSYEIAKADLEIAKKKQKLNNVLNERNVRMFINGQWQWVANTEDVANAKAELADAEYAKRVEESGLKQQESINNLTKQQNELTVVIKKFENGVIDLNTAVQKAKEAIGNMPSALNLSYNKSSSTSSTSSTSTSSSSTSSSSVISGGNSGGGQNKAYISWAKSQMAANSAAWHTADAQGKKSLEAANQSLGKAIGSTYDSTSGTWKHKYATGSKYTKSGLSLFGEEDFEAFIDKNGHLIPINQPTIGNIDSGGVVFNTDQMKNLRTLWDMSNFNINPDRSYISTLQPQQIDQSQDNRIIINNMTVDNGSSDGQALISALRRYVGNH